MFGFLIDHALGQMPTWIWPALAGGSAVVYLLSGIIIHIPNLKIYGFLIKPVAFVVFVASVFLFGGSGVTKILQAQVKDAEDRIAVAQQASKDINDQLTQAIADKSQRVKERVIIVNHAIEVHRNEINADCRLVDATAIKYYNQGVRNQPEETK
jgi:hypothetical protein